RHLNPHLRHAAGVLRTRLAGQTRLAPGLGGGVAVWRRLGGGVPGGRSAHNRPARALPAEQPPRHAEARGVAAPRTIRRWAGPAAPPPDFLEYFVKALFLDELHGVKVDALVLAHAEDRHDVGMVQPRRRSCFPPEPLPMRRAVQSMGGEHLEGDVAA